MAHGDHGSLGPPSDDEPLEEPLELAVRLRRTVGRFTQELPDVFVARRGADALFFPALSWLPGHIPAQELRRSLLPNRPMSGLISASNIAALRWSIPGMVCISRHSS